MKISTRFAAWALLLPLSGCASTLGHDDAQAYKRLPDACSLVSSATLERYIGPAASPEPSHVPEVRSGDKQSLCSWERASQSGSSLLVAETLHANANGGTTSAIRAFQQDRPTPCPSPEHCRPLQGVGSDAYIQGNNLQSSGPMVGDGSIDVHIREKNILIGISYIPATDGSATVPGDSMVIRLTNLAREVAANVRKQEQ